LDDQPEEAAEFLGLAPQRIQNPLGKPAAWRCGKPEVHTDDGAQLALPSEQKKEPETAQGPRPNQRSNGHIPDHGEKEPFVPIDWLMGIIGLLIAEPLCKAGWDSIVSGDHLARGVWAATAGLLLGGGAGSFHWWRHHLQQGQRIAERHIVWWLPLAILILIADLAGPDIYQRATVRRSGPDTGASILTYSQKWTLWDALVNEYSATKIDGICVAHINHNQTLYAESLANDLKSTIDSLRNWKTYQYVSSVQRARGITLAALNEKGTKCAGAFRAALSTIGIGVPPVSKPEDPDGVARLSYANCPGCFEVSIGNQPVQ
jgi:hypothetical protein